MVLGKRLMRILRTVVAAGPGVLESEPDRSRLRQRLIDHGFLKDEVEAVFEWFGIPAVREELLDQFGPFLQGEDGATDEDDLSIATLSRDAVTFLEATKEMGLIDETIEEEILNRLIVVHSGEISLEDTRRMVGTVMFERQFGSEDDYRVFDEEWRLLFT